MADRLLKLLIDEGEEADVEGLLHQALEDVLVGAPGPEQASERDVNHDQRGRQIADLTLDQAKPESM